MKKETVIIVGGGIAGLVSANELTNHYNIILIEADKRLGGRIHSYKEKNFSTIIEAGSEFIHGHLKKTLHLRKKESIEYVPVEGNMYRKEEGSWDKLHEFIV